MAVFLFVFPSYAGCVERVVVSSPYVRQVQGQSMAMPDALTTWGFIRQFKYPWPQGQNPRAFVISKIMPQPPQEQPDILCIQIAPAEISRQMVNSGLPVGAPVGNAGVPITPPPMPSPPLPQGAQAVNSGMYEDIDSSGLPSAVESMFGEGDPSGGTYTDISSNGVEERRSIQRPFGPPPSQRQ